MSVGDGAELINRAAGKGIIFSAHARTDQEMMAIFAGKLAPIRKDA